MTTATAPPLEGEVTLGRELTLTPITTLPAGLPERTLGWQILEFGLDYLEQPDGPFAREPFEPTEEQRRHLLWWYSVDVDGSWTYTSGVLRRMKGWGKDPYACFLCIVEGVGPCRVGGWDANGQPIGVPDPAAWIQVAAVAQEQTKNTMALFPGMLGVRKSHERQGRAIREFGMDVGKTIIYAEGGTRRIEAVTSSPLTLEGPRSTFVLKNETQNWIPRTTNGPEMASVIAGNVAKISAGAGRALSLCNAHKPGRASVAENEYKRWLNIQAGAEPKARFLYDCRESPLVNFKPIATGPKREDSDEREYTDEDIERRDQLVMAGIRASRGGSYWLNVPRLMDEFYDPAVPPSEFRRKYLNQINAAEDGWLAPFEWDANKVEDLEPLAPGEMVTLGADGSRTTAHTFLIACRVRDGALFVRGAWNPADFAGHEIPRGQVRGAVDKCFLELDVVGFYSDVHPFEDLVDDWHQKYREQLCVHATDRNYVGWDHRGRLQTLTKAVEAFRTAVLAKEVPHEGDRRLDQHIYNAVRIENSWGVTYGKESDGSANEVDGADAAVMSRLARSDYLNLPENKQRQKARDPQAW